MEERNQNGSGRSFIFRRYLSLPIRQNRIKKNDSLFFGGCHFLFSISSSISSTSSLVGISRASAIFQTLSKFACLYPLSIIAIWLLAIPASPESTSWESPFFFRKVRITFPTEYLSYSIRHSPFLYSIIKKGCNFCLR